MHLFRRLSFVLCTIFVLSSPLSLANKALAATPTLKLTSCQQIDAAITDIEFFSDTDALITTKDGELYHFSGCDKKSTIISRFEVDAASELGLLGVAISPEKDGRHLTYLYYSPKKVPKLITRLSSFTLTLAKKKGAAPTLVRESENVLLEIAQPYGNHDGGALKIGPMGDLYLGVGDGGAADDPHGHGQNAATLLGSILRIRPDGNHYQVPDGNLSRFNPKAAGEILAMGLRNPWKFAFDSKGNLIVADVGQNKYEEISIIPAEAIGKQALNLGWNTKEGFNCFEPATGCTSEGFLEPVIEYTHRAFGTSITGGETLLFQNKEYYLFADFTSGKLAAIDLDKPGKIATTLSKYSNKWTTFGKINNQVFLGDIDGKLYKIQLSN